MTLEASNDATDGVEIVLYRRRVEPLICRRIEAVL